MKQKYHLRKDVKEKTLRIQEYAVLSANTGKQKYPEIQDDDYSLLCEQTYNSRDVKSASSTGRENLIMLLRNQHFFPIGTYMEQIADVVMDMYASKGEQHEELIFDDKAVLVEAMEAQAALAEIKDNSEKRPAEDEDIDTLIADDSPKKKKK